MTALVLGTVLFFVVRTAWRLNTVKLKLSFEDRTYHPGETVEVLVQITARRGVSWDRVYLSLVCRDRQQEATVPPIWAEDIELTGPGDLEAGSRSLFRTTLLLPEQIEKHGQVINLGGEHSLGTVGDVLGARRARDFSWSVHVHVDGGPVTSVSRMLAFELTPQSRIR